MNIKRNLSQRFKAFTIVELLVVIVVIGILAAITVISYSGINNRASAASVQSDLKNGATKLQMYYIDEGLYPASIDCTSPYDANSICIETSGTNTITSYTANNTANPPTFTLVIEDGSSNNTHYITEALPPTAGEPVVANQYVTIGSQTWMVANLNVGTMINSSESQTDNSIIEKYCYDDDINNCDTYGGLYTWDEAMQYSDTEGGQGICPSGFSVPTLQEYSDLVIEAGGEEIAGYELQPSGSSGFEGLLAGFVGPFYLNERGYYWTSSPGFMNPTLKTFFILKENDTYVDYWEFSRNIAALSVRCIQ